MMLHLVSNIRNLIYRAHSLERVTQTMHHPPVIREPMLRVHNNSLRNLTTSINNSPLLSHNLTKPMQVRAPPSTLTVRAMATDLTLISFQVKCDRGLVT